MSDAGFAFAEYAAAAQLGQYSLEAVERAKQLILDSLMVTRAGSTAAGIDAVVRAVTQWPVADGYPSSRILASAVRVAPPQAALANGAMGTALDFDDTLDEASQHSMPSILWACLATADAAGGCTGGELLAALIAGVEIHGRIGAARRSGQNFSPTGNASGFGAAAACAKLLGLDRDGIHHAMGIAYSQAAGTMQPLLEAALVKRCQAGFGGQAGVLSAFLAREGLTGAREFLEGRFGYFTLYERGNYDRTRLVDGLGQADPEILRYSIKPWPCGRDVHGAVEAALAIRQQGWSDYRRLSKVTVWLPDNPFRVSSKPFTEWSGNRNAAAVISACWPVAAALVYGDVFLDHFTERGLEDESVQRVAALVEVRQLEGKDQATFTPQRVEVRDVDGRTLAIEIDEMLGHPNRPMSPEQLRVKFERLCSYGPSPLDPSSFEALTTAVSNLEKLPDVRQLVTLLNG